MPGNRVLIIGGNAGGMSAAAQLRRLSDDADIVVYEKGPVISYSACGIPFYIGGLIPDCERLIARTPESFAKRGVAVKTMHEVTKIDIAGKSVEVRDLQTDRRFVDRWDKLMISAGASRPMPPIPGADADGIFIMATIPDARRMKRWIEENKPRRALVVGGGYIGLEMADTLSCMLGMELTILEVAPQLMATLDADMASIVQKSLESRGIAVRLEEGIEEFSVRDGRVAAAVTTKKSVIETDIVVLALGIVPNTKLASDAGIATGVKGAIVVDKTMRTSAENVWAAGDCVQSINIVSGEPMHLALGAIANKQGRTAAFDMAGMRSEFPGVLGTAVCKLCGQEIARTGLLERDIQKSGGKYATATVKGKTMAEYMEDSGEMHVKLIADMPTRKILGAQIVGDPCSAKRIDAMAAIITAGMTLEEMLYLDFSYAPPISPLWDPVQQAARTLLSKMDKMI